jgi:hypothetical protein
MSNISKTSANIKKKLSLHDYRKPDNQKASKPALQPSRAPASKHASARKPEIHTADMPAPQQTVMPVKTQKSGEKIKATFNLGEQENKMLMHLFINSLRRNNKIDKSALVCEAIRLLYERDK